MTLTHTDAHWQWTDYHYHYCIVYLSSVSIRLSSVYLLRMDGWMENRTIEQFVTAEAKNVWSKKSQIQSQHHIFVSSLLNLHFSHFTLHHLITIIFGSVKVNLSVCQQTKVDGNGILWGDMLHVFRNSPHHPNHFHHHHHHHQIGNSCEQQWV